MDAPKSQSSLENLRGKPQQERHAIARGLATVVVAALFIAWGAYFVHKIQSSAEGVDFDSGAQRDFNFTNVKEAQQQLMTLYGDISQDLKDLKEQAQQGSEKAKMRVVEQQISGEEVDQFRATETAVQ